MMQKLGKKLSFAKILEDNNLYLYLMPLLIGLFVVVYFHSIVLINRPEYWGDPVWDEDWYITISKNGYTLNSENYMVQSNVVFSPGWPLLMRYASKILHTTVEHTRLIVAIILLLGTSIGMYHVLMLFSRDRIQNNKILLLFFFSPGSFYFLTGYSETLYIFLIVWFFYFLIKKKYIISALISSAALFSRTPAIVLFATFIVSVLLDSWNLDDKRFEWVLIGKLLYLYLPVSIIGILIYMLMLWYSVGDPTAFMKGYLGWRFYTIPRYYNLIFQGPSQVFIHMSIFPSVLLGTTLFVIAPLIIFPVRKHIPISLFMFFIILWLFLLLNNSPYSHVPYLNILRHFSIMFPLHFAIILWIDKLGKIKHSIFLALLIVSMYYYTAFVKLFINAHWVS